MIYIIQIENRKGIWENKWGTTSLKNARDFKKVYLNKGIRARVVKEI